MKNHIQETGKVRLIGKQNLERTQTGEERIIDLSGLASNGLILFGRQCKGSHFESLDLSEGRVPLRIHEFVSMTHGHVSRVHAGIYASDTKKRAYVLMDFGSMNGTYVNREKIGSEIPETMGDPLERRKMFELNKGTKGLQDGDEIHFTGPEYGFMLKFEDTRSLEERLGLRKTKNGYDMGQRYDLSFLFAWEERYQEGLERHHLGFSQELLEYMRREPLIEERDPYMVLGIKPDAKKEEIKRAYHKKMAAYHPDKFSELISQYPRWEEFLNAMTSKITAAKNMIRRR